MSRTAPANLTYPRCWQAIGWLAVLVVVVLTVMPDPPTMHVPVLSWDKAQHTIAYAGLMWWFRQAWRPRRAWIVFLIVLGVSLEAIQWTTNTRHFELADMVANAVGVGFGVLIAATPLGRTLAWMDDRVLRRFLSSPS